MRRPQDDDSEDEFREPKRWAGCRDRMCGATDCPTCFPMSYRNEAEESEAEEQEDEKE